MKIDVCYHLGNGSKWQNNELRYSLRALEKNFLDLGRVFIVGVRPDWLSDEAVYLDVPDRHKHNKDANLVDKVLAACNAGISDLFVRSSDDEMILLPSRLADLRPYHSGDMNGRGTHFWKGGWKAKLRATMNMLVARGFTAFHFDTHIPKVYDRKRFVEVAATTPYQSNGFTIDTMYLNQAGLENPPKLAGQKITLEGAASRKELSVLQHRMRGKRYLGYNDSGLGPQLKKLLGKTFPKPSRFEKTVMKAQRPRKQPQIPVVVAVVGTGRSGTSCTAAIVHHLGVSMGRDLLRASRANPKGFFEANPLRAICRKKCKSTERVKALRDWAVRRGHRDGPIIGCKYPLLCGYVPEMVEAWPDLKVIATERPLDEIVASMMKVGIDRNYQSEQAMRNLAIKRITTRDRDLARLSPPTLRLMFRNVVSDPNGTIEKIVSFIGISPSSEQRRTAAQFVDPALYHHKSKPLNESKEPLR